MGVFMNENILIDNINIKTLPELIVNHLRLHDVNSNLNSVRNIYSLILDCINEDVKDSYLNRIQKYLSSNEQSTILIFDDITNGIYDKELMEACTQIVDKINLIQNRLLYRDLMKKCYFIHFEEDELKNINDSYEKDDNLFIFLLFKHAIKNYKVSPPKILAERLYNDACTLTKTSPLRKNLYKISADLGHPEAALNYATSVYNDYNERLIYFMKAKELNSSLWKIGFIIEHFELSKEQFDWIKKELKDIIMYSNSYPESAVIALRGNNHFEQECIITAYKIYFYLAYEKNFAKGYNSIGKFLINGKVSLEINEKDIDKNKEYGLKYIKKSVSLSNIHAMQNLALYYQRNGMNEEVIKPLLSIGAKCEDLISCVELSKILLKENKIEEALNYLEYAASQHSPYAFYHLGKIYENKFEFDKAKEHYKLAIKYGMRKASIDLAYIYYQEYVDSTDEKLKNTYLLSSINILKNHMDDFDDEDLMTAKKLIHEWEKFLN